MFDFFKKNKKNEKQSLQSEFVTKSTIEKIEQNINECIKNKNHLLDKRDEAFKWINKTINSTFFVPVKWWYKEILFYNSIKELDDNKLLSAEIINQCDDLVLAYQNEMSILDVQIEHYDFLLDSYQKTLQVLTASKDEMKTLKEELQKIKLLDTANEKFSLFKQQETETLTKELIEEENLKQIKDELTNLQRDMKLFEEYIAQLKKISQLH